MNKLRLDHLASPELRALNSRLQECVATMENKALIANKEADKAKEEDRNLRYAGMVREFAEEDRKAASLDESNRRLQAQQLHADLEDQAALEDVRDRASAALHVVQDLYQDSSPDVVELEREREQSKRAKQERQRQEKRVLLLQERMKDLELEKSRFVDANKSRDQEQYLVQKDLEKEIAQQQQEIARLQRNLLEHSMVSELAQAQNVKNTVTDLRLEIDVMEKMATDQKKHEEDVEAERVAKAKQVSDWDDQNLQKRELEETRERKEQEYADILLRVMAEEARLEDLTTAARRRRQLLHRTQVEEFVKERRAIMEARRTIEDQTWDRLDEYDRLRSDLSVEREKSLLLSHLPQLLPFLPPHLLARLAQL
ncbi:uncharacterized protein LOC143028978 [Oratosquilla oratoria]|uniref:uncharacterized protein LOC143028978 n=1 Tax=Oratosquilla oratoria TaxID=337810 RepID=UPI003F759236